MMETGEHRNLGEQLEEAIGLLYYLVLGGHFHFVLRNVLTKVCERVRSKGKKILAGTNIVQPCTMIQGLQVQQK